MTTPARRCSECGAPLGGDPRQKTCSPAHRVQRSRRLAREKKRREERGESATAPQTPESAARASVRAIIEGKTDDVIRDTFVDELRPVVREAIDEDAVRAIKGMVGLAPAAILVLQDDLQSDDPVLRQRAAALIVKYTLGNPNVTPAREGVGAGLTIINQLPDATAAPAVDATVEDAPLALEEGDLRRCDTCQLPRPLAEFPAGGPRCQSCLDSRKASVFEAFSPPPADVATPGDFQSPTPPTSAPLTVLTDLKPGGSAGTFSGPPDPNRFSYGSD